MNCPRCNVPLKTSERQGIQIDSCPNCRGIWLDRGELDKIIQRATLEEAEDASRPHPPPPPPTYTPPPPPGQVTPSQHPYPQPTFPPPPANPRTPPPNPNDESPYGHTPRKKKSIWQELLDF